MVGPSDGDRKPAARQLTPQVPIFNLDDEEEESEMPSCRLFGAPQQSTSKITFDRKMAPQQSAQSSSSNPPSGTLGGGVTLTVNGGFSIGSGGTRTCTPARGFMTAKERHKDRMATFGHCRTPSSKSKSSEHLSKSSANRNRRQLDGLIPSTPPLFASSFASSASARAMAEPSATIVNPLLGLNDPTVTLIPEPPSSVFRSPAAQV